LLGICLSALPATALAYLGEEIHSDHLGRSIGLYIAGNALGGMSGRLLALTLSEWMDWHVALALMGLLAFCVALHVMRALPASRHFVSARGGQNVPAVLKSHLTDEGLPWLFVMAFLLSGCVVSVYNYISFRLSAAPWYFNSYALCGIYALYLLGMLGSSRIGALADRLGRGAVLWWCPVIMAAGLLLTAASSLPLIVVGMALMTFGFFAGHSVASSWVSRRARQGRALASSLYLMMYYLGASVLGTVSGSAWTAGQWPGVALMVAGVLTACLAVSLRLRGLKPLAPH
jgi:YNFM family putative membrane transporter